MGIRSRRRNDGRKEAGTMKDALVENRVDYVPWPKGINYGQCVLPHEKFGELPFQSELPDLAHTPPSSADPEREVKKPRGWK